MAENGSIIGTFGPVIGGEILQAAYLHICKHICELDRSVWRVSSCNAVVSGISSGIIFFWKHAICMGR